LEKNNLRYAILKFGSDIVTKAKLCKYLTDNSLRMGVIFSGTISLVEK